MLLHARDQDDRADGRRDQAAHEARCREPDQEAAEDRADHTHHEITCEPRAAKYPRLGSNQQPSASEADALSN